MTWAIGDIHGRFDLLQRLLADIDAQSSGAKTIVFLGDYIDRGPQNREVIDLLMRGPQCGSDRWICLKGNHEQMMADTYRQDLDPAWWLGNGGKETLKSFDGTVPTEVIDWCDNLSVSHETDTHFFVHAGIRPGLSLKLQDTETMLWIRGPFLEDDSDHGKHIVHGHTPHREVELLQNRTNLDTGAVYYGTLTAALFDLPGGPTNIITAIG